MSKKEQLDQMQLELNAIKAIVANLIELGDIHNKKLDHHTEGLKIIGVATHQILSDIASQFDDERNQPYDKAELGGGEEYVMPDNDIVWLYCGNVRLMIEDVGGEMILSAFRNTEEAEEPFSMMRVPK